MERKFLLVKLFSFVNWSPTADAAFFNPFPVALAAVFNPCPVALAAVFNPCPVAVAAAPNALPTFSVVESIVDIYGNDEESLHDMVMKMGKTITAAQKPSLSRMSPMGNL